MSNSLDMFNIDTDAPSQYTQYDIPQPPFIPQDVVTGDVNIVTTINGSTGPITFSSPDGFAFSGGTGGSVVFTVSNPATARAALGAAASGVNTDITELNGASQVDVSARYEVAGTQVVTAQQAAIPNAILGTEVATINLILAALRTHGLIAT